MPSRFKQALRPVRGAAARITAGLGDAALLGRFVHPITALLVLTIGLCLVTGVAAKAGRGREARPKVDVYGDPLPPGAVLRLGTTRFRHEGAACSLVYSPDGKFLAAKSQDGVIILWDARTGVPRLRIHTPFWDTGFAFSPTSRMLASAGDQRHIYFWDVATGKVLRKIALPDALAVDPEGGNDLRIRFSSDGKRLALGETGRSCVLDVEAGKVLHLFKEDQAGAVIDWSPEGKTLAMCVSKDSEPPSHEILVRSAQTGNVLRRLQGHSTEIGAIAFSPDGKRLASGSREGIILWDAVTGKVLRRIEQKEDYVPGLAFTPDGKTLVSGDQAEGVVHVWDVDTGKERRRLDARLYVLQSMALSPDGKTVAAGGHYNTIRLWNRATGRELFTEQQGHDADVNSLAYSPDGKLLVSEGGNGKGWIWDARTGKPMRRLHGSSVKVSPDGQRLAMLASEWNKGKAVQIQNLVSGKELLRLPLSDVVAGAALAFSPDGKTILTADRLLSEAIGEVNVWDAVTGRRLHRCPVEGFRSGRLAVDPEGKTLAVGGASEQEKIRLWDLRRRETILSLPGETDQAYALAFSPDGRTLLSESPEGLQLWETATGKEILHLKGNKQTVCLAVAFSPDGRVIAHGGYDRQKIAIATLTRRAQPIRFWDLSTGAALPPLEGCHSAVNSLAFSRDGAHLASGFADGAILLWEAPRGTVPPKGAPLSGAGELAVHWSALAGKDAGKAHAAGWKLTAAAEAAVPYLARRLIPAVVDAKRVRKLIADLDSDVFAVRQAATRELEGMGRDADAFLREALAGKPPLELYRRLEILLARTRAPISGEQLRGVRAVGVLERIATPAAQTLLERLAKGAPQARLTQEAKASLQRIAGRSSEGKKR